MMLFLVSRNTLCMKMEIEPVQEIQQCGLPTEIWKIVFFYCFDPSENMPDKACALKMLANLSEVCKQWYGVTGRGETAQFAQWLNCIWDKGYGFTVLTDPQGTLLSILWHDNITVLHFAVARGLQGLVEYYLDAKPERINELDKYSYSLFHYAIVNNRLAIIQMLVCRPECNINLKDCLNTTPLAYAICCPSLKDDERQSIVDLILEDAKNLDLSIVCDCTDVGENILQKTALEIATLKELWSIVHAITESQRISKHCINKR